MKLADFMTDDQMKTLIAGAILGAISPEQREKMLTAAVGNLLVPKDGMYGRRTAPMQDAFNEAAGWVARKMVQDMMENDPKMKEQIRGLIEAASEQAFVTNREKTIDRMAEAISRAMERE